MKERREERGERARREIANRKDTSWNSMSAPERGSRNMKISFKQKIRKKKKEREREGMRDKEKVRK